MDTVVFGRSLKSLRPLPRPPADDYRIRHRRRNTIMYTTVGPVKMFRPYFVVKRFGFVDVFHGRRLNASAERGDHRAHERRRHGNRGATHRKSRVVWRLNAFIFFFLYFTFYALACAISRLPGTAYTNPRAVTASFSVPNGRKRRVYRNK